MVDAKALQENLLKFARLDQPIHNRQKPNTKGRKKQSLNKLDQYQCHFFLVEHHIFIQYTKF